jgi:hypothetical protein
VFEASPFKVLRPQGDKLADAFRSQPHFAAAPVESAGGVIAAPVEVLSQTFEHASGKDRHTLAPTFELANDPACA